MNMISQLKLKIFGKRKQGENIIEKQPTTRLVKPNESLPQKEWFTTLGVSQPNKVEVTINNLVEKDNIPLIKLIIKKRHNINELV